MASIHEPVTLSGRLVGMGRNVPCNVQTTRVSLPGRADYNYGRAYITNEPSDLPDGPYSVTYDGITQNVQRRDGAWIAPVAG
jgi:hypothetical protein